MLKKNLDPSKIVMGIFEKKLKSLIQEQIGGIEGETVVFGYKRDVEQFKRCMPFDFGRVKFEYTEPEDWETYSQDTELIHRIVGFRCARLIIVSEYLRNLLAANLISRGVSYEIVDIYELMKMDQSIVLRMGIGSTWEEKLQESIKRYIKWTGVFLS